MTASYVFVRPHDVMVTTTVLSTSKVNHAVEWSLLLLVGQLCDYDYD